MSFLTGRSGRFPEAKPGFAWSKLLLQGQPLSEPLVELALMNPTASRPHHSIKSLAPDTYREPSTKTTNFNAVGPQLSSYT